MSLTYHLMKHFIKIFDCYIARYQKKDFIFKTTLIYKIKAGKRLLILLTQSKPVTKQPAIRSVQFWGVDSAFLSKLPEELV